MSYYINVEATVWIAATVEISDEHLTVMVGYGVDVLDPNEVSDFYRLHLDEEIDGVWFYDANSMIDRGETERDRAQVSDFWVEGEAPEEFWPDEDDDTDGTDGGAA